MKQGEQVTSIEDYTSLTIDIEGLSVSFNKFRQAQDKLATILQEVEQTLSKGKRSSINWVISSIESGSIHLTLKAVPNKDVKAKDIANVISVIESGIAMIAERPERPPFFSDRALIGAKELASLVAQDIEKIELRVNNNKINFAQNLVTNVKEILEGTYKSYGSVEGILKALDVSQSKPFFRLYDLLTNKGIPCYFSSYSLNAIKDAFEKRVLVYGLISSRGDGRKVSIDVETIEVLPNEKDLPSIEDMIGILGGEA